MASRANLSTLFEGRTVEYVQEELAGEGANGRPIRGQLKIMFTDGTSLKVTAFESEEDNKPLLDLQVQL